MFTQIQYPTFENEIQLDNKSGISFIVSIAIITILVVFAGIIFIKRNQDYDNKMVGPLKPYPGNGIINSLNENIPSNGKK